VVRLKNGVWLPMGMEQELADFRTEFERTAPAGRAAPYEAKVGRLRANFPLLTKFPPVLEQRRSSSSR